jgi:hypothetical protein
VGSARPSQDLETTKKGESTLRWQILWFADRPDSGGTVLSVGGEHARWLMLMPSAGGSQQQRKRQAHIGDEWSPLFCRYPLVLIECCEMEGTHKLSVAVPACTRPSRAHVKYVDSFITSGWRRPQPGSWQQGKVRRLKNRCVLFQGADKNTVVFGPTQQRLREWLVRMERRWGWCKCRNYYGTRCQLVHAHAVLRLIPMRST